MPQQRIPFLMTLDVHSRRTKNLDLKRELAVCLRVLSDARIPTTFFVPAALIDECGADLLRSIVAEGHQVACHGFTHRQPEDFARDSFDVQKDTLQRAKDALETATGATITTFRGPAFVISATTLRALEATGYQADLSVNSQRLGILSSQVKNTGWLRAPRVPYHPSPTDPYRRGTLRLWEIPMTAFVLPYVSMLYQSLGLPFAQAFAHCLHAEARWTRSKPVVYMAHPEEYYPSTYVRGKVPVNWQMLVPHPRQGIRARRLLLESDEYRIYEKTMAMLRFHMKQRDRFDFLTVDQYLERLTLSAPGEQLRPATAA